MNGTLCVLGRFLYTSLIILEMITKQTWEGATTVVQKTLLQTTLDQMTLHQKWHETKNIFGLNFRLKSDISPKGKN